MEELDRILQLGKVTVVDAEKRLVKVFHEATGITSDWLKVVQNQPLITIEKYVEELGSENKWEYDATYNSYDRGLGLGEKYEKAQYETLKDVIINEKVIKYEKRETINENKPIECLDGHGQACAVCGAPIQTCPINGVIENKKHRQVVTVYPWLPYIGQTVLCLYEPGWNSNGFVIGGL